MQLPHGGNAAGQRRARQALVIQTAQIVPDVVACGVAKVDVALAQGTGVVLEIAFIGRKGVRPGAAFDTHHLQESLDELPVLSGHRRQLSNREDGSGLTTSDFSGGKLASPHTAP